MDWGNSKFKIQNSQFEVSAIVTTYNYARFIEGAIECALAQTRRPDEIVVVDDGSTDDTADRVARYAPEGVRYVYKENGGAGSARNRGIKETSGDLLVFLDADDRWVPEKTARQMDHLRRYPGVGLVTGSEWQVYGEGQPPRYIERQPVGAADLYSRLLVENVVGNPSGVMVRRECFERVGLFNERLRLGQDWDLWIRIARRFPVGVVDAPLLRYSRHEGSLTAGQAWARYRSNRQIHSRHIRRERRFSTRLDLLRKAQSMNFLYTAAALLEGDTQRAATLVLALGSLLLDPTYQARLKLGALFRAAFGQTAFDRLKEAMRG